MWGGLLCQLEEESFIFSALVLLQAGRSEVSWCLLSFSLIDKYVSTQILKGLEKQDFLVFNRPSFRSFSAFAGLCSHGKMVQPILGFFARSWTFDFGFSVIHGWRGGSVFPNWFSKQLPKPSLGLVVSTLVPLLRSTPGLCVSFLAALSSSPRRSGLGPTSLNYGLLRSSATTTENRVGFSACFSGMELSYLCTGCLGSKRTQSIVNKHTHTHKPLSFA